MSSNSRKSPARITIFDTLEFWGFTSDRHPLFQIPNSSPVSDAWLLAIFNSQLISKGLFDVFKSTAVKNEVKNIQTAGYNGALTVDRIRVIKPG